MGRRQKLQVQWHRQLKLDDISIENGFTKRLFRQTEVYNIDLMAYDYPPREFFNRSWKKYRKTQYKAK